MLNGQQKKRGEMLLPLTIYTIHHFTALVSAQKLQAEMKNTHTKNSKNHTMLCFSCVCKELFK